MRISDWSSDVCSSDLYSGCTRDDFAAKNAAARAALEKFGELPQEVLEGTRRSKFAPPIARRGLQQRSDGSAAAPDRKSVVQGKSVSVRVDLGGRSIIKKKN